MRNLLAAVVLLFACAVAPHAFGIGQQQYVQTSASGNAFPLVQGNRAAAIFADSADWPGVLRAAKDLQSDIERTTGRRPVLSTDAASGLPVIIGTIGKSRIVDALIKSGKIDARDISGQWESFFIQTVERPLPNVPRALVIAGSDKRGTIYGIYDLSEQIGVSPWYWWADVPVRRKTSLYIKPGRYAQGPPSVKYRGIFLNDEAPDLTGWVRETYGTIPPQSDPPIPNDVARYGSEFYCRVFELILRMKGNYLWPAMWNNAFNEDDPNNARLADEYGIVMGTSHQEPMLRAQKEWDRRFQKTLGSWNYFKHPDVLQKFWRDGIRRNKDFESIITIGLRGADDTPMIPGGTAAQSMTLLEEIVGVQRRMIAEEINPDVTRVPQLWCLYKEVQEFYAKGLRVPDDVTLLWADDNWGNIRRLPTAEERKRPGGAGVYYHFDYVGGPRNYKWVNTNPLPKIWEQMTLAKEYGADRIWIVNVGHLRGLEIPIEYFMHLAWNTGRWTNRNIDEYTRLWAAREFGREYSGEIAEIVSGYARFNGRRKPELLAPGTYSLVDYQEADRVVEDYRLLVRKAETLYRKVPAQWRDAFYHLVLFTTKACAQVNELYVAAGKNALYARQGRSTANDQAERVETLFKADADLMDHYNHVYAGGKWNHFMDQVHIGYTIWQDPPRNIMPKVTRLEVPEKASMGIALEGSASAWPGAPEEPALPRFDPYGAGRRYVEVFNRGQQPFEFTAAPSRPWIRLSEKRGMVAKEARLWVSIDWNRAPAGAAQGFITISRKGGEEVRVKVESFKREPPEGDLLGAFIEGDGVVSIEAEHYSRNVPADGSRWEKIEGYGRTLSAMSVLPVTAPSVDPFKDSPRLEYRVYLFGAGKVDVFATVAPTLNFVPGRGLRYAVSFDDEPPQIVEIVSPEFDARNGNREWEESVKNSCRTVRSSHTVGKPGLHTLKIWMVDPAVVLEKIVLDLGGVRPSYLGPPESRRMDGARSSGMR